MLSLSLNLMKWVKISESIPSENKILRLKILGRNICLVNLHQKVYAFSAKCPHAGADLSGGWCEGDFWVCPVHRHKYNLENGRGEEGQGDYLKIYQTEKRSDGIYIMMKSSWKDLFKW